MFGISPLNLLEKILSATNFGLDIIVDVCPEAGKVANTNKNFRLRSDDRTPSAHLYPPANGQGYWRVVDFGMGEGSRSFSPIDLYMWNMGYSQSQFSVALKELAQKYGVDERLNASVNRPIITQREALPVELGLPPKLEFYNGFAGVDLSVWGPKVKPEHLEAYHWRAVKSMAFVRDGKATTIVATDTYPIFAEECSYYDNSQKQKVFWKVYEPKNSDKAFRFRIIGQVPNNYIYGLDTLRQEWHKNGEEKLEVVLLSAQKAWDISAFG